MSIMSWLFWIVPAVLIMMGWGMSFIYLNSWLLYMAIGFLVVLTVGYALFLFMMGSLKM